MIAFLITLVVGLYVIAAPWKSTNDRCGDTPGRPPPGVNRMTPDESYEDEAPPRRDEGILGEPVIDGAWPDALERPIGGLCDFD